MCGEVEHDKCRWGRDWRSPVGDGGKVLRWKSLAPQESFSMSAGYAKEGDPHHPCYA
jgi:hypothetical protein